MKVKQSMQDTRLGLPCLLPEQVDWTIALLVIVYYSTVQCSVKVDWIKHHVTCRLDSIGRLDH